jgi:hypothetical protein
MAAPGHFVPGVTRPSIFFCSMRKKMDARVKPAHDELVGNG